MLNGNIGKILLISDLYKISRIIKESLPFWKTNILFETEDLAFKEGDNL